MVILKHGRREIFFLTFSFLNSLNTCLISSKMKYIENKIPIINKLNLKRSLFFVKSYECLKFQETHKPNVIHVATYATVKKKLNQAFNLNFNNLI